MSLIETPRVWAGPAGACLDDALAGFLRNADAYGDGPVAHYATLLSSIIRDQQVRARPRESHPRVTIRGIREARLDAADVVILAGLNDGTWPAPADPGPWLSRPMHSELRLPAPERSVGLAAHDFLQSVCRPRVILSRAAKVDGAPTVPSRWLIRLMTLLNGIGAGDHWGAAIERGARYIDCAVLMEQPETIEAPAPRPRPKPPQEVRPRRLSVNWYREIDPGPLRDLCPRCVASQTARSAWPQCRCA